MSNMINQVRLYIIIGFLILFLIIAAIIVLIILFKRKDSASEEKTDYRQFERRDVLDYVKFDDIISSSDNPDDFLKGAGVIVRNNGTTFISAVQVTGFNFYDASYEEQVKCINATISMMAALEKRVTFRQTSYAINIEHNIDEHMEIAQKLKKEIISLNERLKEATADAEDNIDNDDIYNVYMEEINHLSRIISIKAIQLDEAKELVDCMQKMSKYSDDTEKISHIIFSYNFDANQFTTQLTKEEIYMTAMQDLASRAAGFISALVRCGCSARRCTAEEVIDVMRKHMHPVTGDEVSLSELLGSSINSLFVTSDSLYKAMMEQISETEFIKKMSDYEKMVNETLKRKDLEAEKQETDRLENTAGYISANQTVKFS